MTPTRHMTRAAVAALAVLLPVCSALAYPKPSAVPPRWELEFEPGELRLYVDQAGGDTYWHVTYKVTNRTGREQIWAPKFTLYTDAGEIMVSGRGVPGRVAQDIRELLGNDLLENQNQIIGEIFHGREHAKEGLVIWPAPSADVNELSMFVAGTSGETATIIHPLTGRRLVLRKTLQRDYLVPGEAIPRGNKPVEAVTERWVMR